MVSVEGYKLFIDDKFVGIQKLDDCFNSNLSAFNKIIRLFKEYYLAQDSYSKSLSKSNSNLAQLSKNRYDSFSPMFDAFSTTFCVFANVQKEFTDSLSKIIRSLTLAYESKEEAQLKVLNFRDENVVASFKNIQVQLSKAKQRYHSTCQYSVDASVKSDRADKEIHRAKENYEMCLNKYNKLREDFFDVVRNGFERCKQSQLSHLETMRKCVKNVGNALAKLIFDMTQSVDSLKSFYRSNSKEDLFQLWADSNKTVNDISVESFPELRMEIPTSTTSEDLLVDVSASPVEGHSIVPNTPETRWNKLFQSRRHTTNSINTQNIIEQDIPDASNKDPISGHNRVIDNINAFKSSKKKWSGLAILKKFQSTNDLSNGSDARKSPAEDGWRSRSNVNETVFVDDEGFVVRDAHTESNNNNLSRSSSSSSSSVNPLKGIKVNILPVSHAVDKTRSDLDVANVILPIPIRKSDRMRIDNVKRVSNLQRSSRRVSDLSRDRFTFRSMSVSELNCLERSNLESPTKVEKKYGEDSCVIPIACALTEILSSNNDGHSCNIQGQLVLAVPLVIKERLKSLSDSPLPPQIILDLVSTSYPFTSAHLLTQYQDVARLESNNGNTYSINIMKELLQRIATDPSLLSKRSRISFPLLEYSISVNQSQKTIVECQGMWSKLQDNLVQFNFTLSSKYLKERRCIKVKVRLLTTGFIEDVSTNGGALSVDTPHPRYLVVPVSRSDQLISLHIRHEKSSVVKLKLCYDFVFENCSVVTPQVLLRSDAFQLSLTHYRTISNGSLSQSFDFNIS